MKKKELTPKQEKYCQMYVKYSNKSVAYRKAYNTENMKPESVHQKAFEVHNNVKIQLRIEELQKQLEKRNALSLDKVVQALSEIATFDIQDIYDDDGNVKPLSEIPKSARMAIQSVKSFEIGSDKKGTKATIRYVKLLNKLEAFDKLMKHFGGYEKDNTQKVAPANISFKIINKEKKTSE